MRINLWFSEDIQRWHWVLIHDRSVGIQHEGGESGELRDALNDIAKTVEHVERCYQSDAVNAVKS